MVNRFIRRTFLKGEVTERVAPLAGDITGQTCTHNHKHNHNVIACLIVCWFCSQSSIQIDYLYAGESHRLVGNQINILVYCSGYEI